MLNLLNNAIRWAFYALFFLVPLVFYHRTSELFEYNKMMLTYGLTVVIVATWIAKMILQRQIIFRRTFLDLPITLYLISHILSTILSIDQHTSIWGYYSRFHEGLLASIAYIVLFYALVSNLEKKDILKIFGVSFASGAIVSLWGLLEHLGASPSCVIITGNFDVNCWIQDVKSRVFATLGQPNWMAAYLDVLILTGLGLVFSIKGRAESSYLIQNTKYLILLSLLFAALLFTKSRSGILGLIAGIGIMGVTILWKNWREIKSSRPAALARTARTPVLLGLLLALLSFIIGLPLPFIDKFTLPNLLAKPVIEQEIKKPDLGYIDIGVTESGDIRQIVWQGAFKIWQRYPVFGSGVETFAYAYYLDRPVEHNMVSEWDFLYNKAHNEFLNILATTGTVGILAYLFLIASFSYWVLKHLSPLSKPQSIVSLPTTHYFLIAALYAAYISILVTNFFGFSVVIIGLYFFLIPGFCLLLSNKEESISGISGKNPVKSQIPSGINPGQYITIGVITIVALVIEWNLLNKWSADVDYGWGKNYDSIQGFTQANPYLISAAAKDPGEPVFQDELSYNAAVIASSSFDKAQELNLATPSAMEKIQPYVDLAIQTSNTAVSAQPNNVIFWRTRTKVFNQLATIDERYLLEALKAIIKSSELAPTDPRVVYNLGIILGQVGETDRAIAAFERATQLKPNYADPRNALGLYYDQIGDKARAREQFEFMLKNIGFDERAQKWLDENP